MLEKKVCNDKTKFYQEKLEHFEKHLGDYSNIIFALKRRNSLESSALKVYKKYVAQLKFSIGSFSQLKHGLMSRLKMCQRNGPKTWSTTVSYFKEKLPQHYESKNKNINIEKIKSMIDLAN